MTTPRMARRADGRVGLARLYMVLTILTSLAPWALASAAEPSVDEARAAIGRAAAFFRDKVSSGGGYVWRYSADLKHRQGEAVTGPTTVWVQPPGTPTIGDVFLDAYEATDEPAYLAAARDAAAVLVSGQLRSGGWQYSIELDPAAREKLDYRSVSKPPRKPQKTTLDDNTTQATTSFLMRLDKLLAQKDAAVHEAVEFALTGLLRAQYPNGGWYVSWDRYPEPPSAADYPVERASYPESWSKKWLNDFPGRYVLNDNLMADMIGLMLQAADTYGDARFREAAERAGRFLILAQMPEPQPAWAQQYDVKMQPCWARKFEPPAITASESQGVMQALMRLYRATGKREFLEPIPRAVEYLRKSQLPDGRLARFYELKTNRPLYFERYDDRYDLSYEVTPRLPDHYAFLIESRLDAIEREYRRLADAPWKATEKSASTARSRPSAARVREVIDSLDERGAWTEPGWVRDAEGKKLEPAGGVILCETFAKNLRLLSDYVRGAE